VKQFENEYAMHNKFDKEYKARTHERLTTFLKLCKKYLKKLENMISLYTKFDHSKLTSLSESKEAILEELMRTLSQYSKTINNSNLINSLLENENSNFIEVDDDIDDGQDDAEAFYKNESLLVDVIKKLEHQIKKLEDENIGLANRRNEVSFL
jgi:hypothetical protein